MDSVCVVYRRTLDEWNGVDEASSLYFPFLGKSEVQHESATANCTDYIEEMAWTQSDNEADKAMLQAMLFERTQCIIACFVFIQTSRFEICIIFVWCFQILLILYCRFITNTIY